MRNLSTRGVQFQKQSTFLREVLRIILLPDVSILKVKDGKMRNARKCRLGLQKPHSRIVVSFGLS